MADLTDREACPVTFEDFAAAGPNQPVFLPACGHTFSRIAVQNILHARHSRHMPAVRCPLCATVQPNNMRMETLVCSFQHFEHICPWDTIRRVEQLKTAKAAKAKAEAEAREAAAQEAQAAAARAAATASSLGVSEFDYDDDDLTQYSGTPFEHIQKLWDLKLFRPPSTLQNTDLQQLCSNASAATPGSTLDMSGRELPFSTVNNWITAAFLSNHHLVDARIQPQLTLLDASNDEWAWDLAVPLDKLHLWTLSAEDVSICNAHIRLPSDGVLLLQADSKVTFYNLTLEGGTVVCASRSTKAIFESVRVIGATVVVTGGANAIVSRCQILDCPVAIIVHGAGTHALVRNCAARGCAAFVVATGGASALVKDSTVEMADSGAVAVDVRGPGSRLQASDTTMKGATHANTSNTDPGNLAGFSLGGRGIRGGNGATIELVKYNISGFMTGMDICGAGTVIEARECQMHENVRCAISVREGAAAELVGCSAGRGGNQALVVRDLGTSVRADRCGLGGTTGDALVAADGAGVRLKQSNIAHVVNGCAVAACGTSSRVKCEECAIDDNGGGGFKVSASASCTLSECKITQSRGTGVAVSGAGSQVDLTICHVEGHEAAGLGATDGGKLIAEECVVMGCKSAGAAISGPQSHLHAKECYFADNQQVVVDVSAGATALLLDGQMWHSAQGSAVRVRGQGSRVDMQSVEATATDAAILALEGAFAEAHKCTLDSGPRVRGAGTTVKLCECSVQGASLVKRDALLIAESSEFAVKPQLAPDTVPVPSSADNIQLSEDSTWRLQPFQRDDLCMYITDPEWNGMLAALERGETFSPGGLSSGTYPPIASGVGVRPHAGRNVQASHEAMLAEIGGQEGEGLQGLDAAFSASSAAITANTASTILAAAARLGMATTVGGSSSRTATMRASEEVLVNGHHTGTTHAGEDPSLPNSAAAAQRSASARSRTFWRPNRSNNWPSMFSSGSSRRREQGADGSPTEAASTSAASSSNTQAVAGAPAATSSHTAPSHAITATNSSSFRASSELQNGFVSASAAPGGAPFYADATPAAAQAQHQAADALQMSVGQQAQSAAQAVPSQHQRQFQRMPQLLTTNYDSGAQPSTEDSTSAASTLNAPVHGAFLPPEDLADMHAASFLGREPLRSSTQMTADAAQAETTLSPHVPVRGSARDREQRNTRENREQAAAGVAVGDSAVTPQGAVQHTRRTGPSRRNQGLTQASSSSRSGNEAALDLFPRHTSSSSALPPHVRSASGTASTGAGAIDSQSAHQDSLQINGEHVATGARTLPQEAMHEAQASHVEIPQPERSASARTQGDAANAAETAAARSVRSENRGDGSRRSGIMGAAAAMRSRLRRARSSRES